MDQLEDTLGSISTLYRRLAETEGSVSAMIHKPEPGVVYWIEINPVGTAYRCRRRPSGGPLIQKHLWHPKNSVILVSATLLRQETAT
jgi:Rad3-related DNA helicase